MSAPRILTAVTVLLLLTSAAAAATDIGLVEVKNRFQAQVVEGILDHAYTRVENKFLVVVDSEQAQLLNQSGIKFDILLEDTEPSSLYLVRPTDRGPSPRISLDGPADAIDIGKGMKLTRMSNYVSKVAQGEVGITARPLEDLTVRFTFMPTVVATALSALTEFPTDTLINLVDMDSIYAYDTRLEAFQTRYIWTDSIDASRDWIADKFRSWGYTDVTTPELYWNGGWHYNVMCVKEGYAEPDKVIVVGGHYDSITYGQVPGASLYAPGADDNASGTVAAMELARILADVPLRKTVIFMAFTAEEVGLVGSEAAALDFVNAGTDLEVMHNYDMIGFTADSYWDLDFASGPNAAYMHVSMDALTRLTSLIPVVTSLGSGSDHWSFHEQGYDVVDCIEGDFNWDGWHTNLDVSTRMNFPYFTEVVKMAVASLAIVANAASPTEIESLVDMGDGQAVEVTWADCNDAYTYTINYGTSPGVYTNSVSVPAGMCSYTVDGLSNGVTYYFSVIGNAVDGYPAVYGTEASIAPNIIPRAPAPLVATPGYQEIILDWPVGLEADIAFYRVRRDDGSGYVLYQDNVLAPPFTDAAVVGQSEYKYQITAVDNDMNESALSNESRCYAGTFDGGILFIDETGANPPLPNQTVQEAFFAYIMAGTPYTLKQVNVLADTLTKSNAGRYSSIFWIDDDINSQQIIFSTPSLSWYTDFTDNVFVAGFRTIKYWSTSPVAADHILYDQFGVTSYLENSNFDFLAARGQDGWPDAIVDLTNPFGKLPSVPKLEVAPGATVIYTYDSFTDNPAFEGEPCGVMYETPNGIRVVLGFPLYFLTDASARAIMWHVKNLYGESEPYMGGDIDGSGELNIADIIALVDYMFTGGPEPLNLNTADVDGSCQINIADLVYFVNYSFGDPAGPAPLQGCVY